MIADVSPVVLPYPNELDLVPGDYIESPSGVYYATLLSNGQFVVSQGTDPATSGVHPVWSTPAVPNPVNPTVSFGGDFGASFSVSTSPQPNVHVVWYIYGGATNPGDGTVLSLADNGALTFASGTDPAHPIQQTFSNNVNDPVVSYDLTGITYDLAHPTISSSEQVAGVVYNAKNETSQTQTYPASLTLKYVKSSNWSFSVSEAIMLGEKTQFNVGLPGIGETNSEISISETTTVGTVEGGSTSEEKDFEAGVDITVPGNSFYQAVLTGTEETFDIPFTYTGVAQYQDGAMVPVEGSGTFTGSDTGVFETVISCVSTPGGCSMTSPSPGAPVPEPSTWAMLLIGFLGLGAAAGYRASRSKRADEYPTALRG